MNSTLNLIFLIISTFQILKSTQFLIPCKTPEGTSGSCVDIHECQPIHNYVKKSNYVFTQKLRQFIKERTCEYTGQQLKVCCSKVPIISNIDNQYLKHNSAQQIPNNLVHKNSKLLPLECGINKNRNIAAFEAKTSLSKTNGQAATLNEFPWMALLSCATDKGTAFCCVGTIINERYILTAANCINKPLRSVRVGEHNIALPNDCVKDDFNTLKCSPPTEDIAIEKAFHHKEFKISFTRHDIGLIRLSKPLNIYTENVKAICLPLQNSLTSIDALHIPLTLTGWGVTKKDFKSKVLSKADVSTIREDDCSEAYKKRSYDPMLSDKQFCIAGRPNGTRNLCCGDTGSPLQMLNDTRYTQYGIVSVGPYSCVKNSIPIINTKVDRYIDWILDNIEP